MLASERAKTIEAVASNGAAIEPEPKDATQPIATEASK
jgi:hypothetical protein